MWALTHPNKRLTFTLHFWEQLKRLRQNFRENNCKFLSICGRFWQKWTLTTKQKHWRNCPSSYIWVLLHHHLTTISELIKTTSAIRVRVKKYRKKSFFLYFKKLYLPLLLFLYQSVFISTIWTSICGLRYLSVSVEPELHIYSLCSVFLELFWPLILGG